MDEVKKINRIREILESKKDTTFTFPSTSIDQSETEEHTTPKEDEYGPPIQSMREAASIRSQKTITKVFKTPRGEHYLGWRKYRNYIHTLLAGFGENRFHGHIRLDEKGKIIACDHNAETILGMTEIEMKNYAGFHYVIDDDIDRIMDGILNSTRMYADFFDKFVMFHHGSFKYVLCELKVLYKNYVVCGSEGILVEMTKEEYDQTEIVSTLDFHYETESLEEKIQHSVEDMIDGDSDPKHKKHILRRFFGSCCDCSGNNCKFSFNLKLPCIG